MKILLVMRIACLFFLCCFSIYVPEALAQRKLWGQVMDKETNKPISRATVKVVGTNMGTSCDVHGQFEIPLKADSSIQIIVSALGYSDFRNSYIPTSEKIKVLMEPSNTLIDAISVSSKKKYNNKNPAVELIDEVIKHKRINRMEKLPKHSFEQYDKLRFSLVDPPSAAQKGLGSMRFFFENLDTLSLPGSKLLTILMKEQLSDVYSSSEVSGSKKIVKSVLQTDYDERYINNHNIQSYLTYLFQDVDIYSENIFLINKLFLSPIANNAPVFYKYYIVDTVNTDAGAMVELNFEPRNKADLLLSGKLWVSMDGRYAVSKVHLSANKEANLNWVNRMDIDLRFIANEQQQMYLAYSDVQIMFGSSKKEALFGQKITQNSKFNYNADFPDILLSGAPLEILASAKDSTLLTRDRPIPLAGAEANVYANVKALNANKNFKTIMAVGYLLAQGFYNLGPVELGPLEYVYSRNNIEGNRVRIGGRTTQLLSEKLFIEGYLAYGMDDQQFKYYVRPTFSLNGKSVATFPAHYLQLSVQHDIFDPGRNLGFRKGDSFFQSLRSNKPTKWMDTYAYQASHLLEFGNHLSIQSGFTHHRRRAIGDLNFISSGDPTLKLLAINTNELEFVLRWAPNEKFYYRNLVRTSIKEKYPIFNLQYNRGLSGFWDGNYSYDALRANVTKRLFLRQLGYADITLSGGKIWGTLPYPLLEIPDQYKEEDRHVVDYSLMRSMEFAADKFVRFSFDHAFDGFIFNKIPFIKKFKLRESWGVKMFYGELSDKNNPYKSSQVIHFDSDKEGNKLTHVLGDKPYWEAKAGIDNIFRLLRVEYIRRLNYLDLPNVDKDTYRVSLHLNF